MTIQDLHALFLKSKGVTTDTRKIEPNAIFFALKGDNFNGNKYALEALKLGACYAVVDEEIYQTEKRIILVEDVLKALQNLAYTHRKFLDIPIIALTGSNGKTTTKELINAVLSKKFRTVATLGNLNNHIGVPLTLLAMNSETELGIVEMGANHIGEIAELAAIAAPDFGYITNFGKAHLEGFGSVEGVIKGKSELYNYLIDHKGSLFLNTDDAIQKKKIGTTHTFTFSATADADVKIEYKLAQPFAKIQFNYQEVKSQLIGQYNAVNLAAAATIGTFFKVGDDQIIDALESYTPSNNRSQIIKKNHLTIILDAYNANPTSMEAAVFNFANLEGKHKIAFLGDMFELGQTAAMEHQKIANLTGELGLKNVVFLGENFKNTSTPNYQFKNLKTLQENGFPQNIKEVLMQEVTILIKGSRGMRLEGILDMLTA
ncbi:UDP-N-acetylmuramoyl-tripeptide--D-alanyl-D-alanine ligase [Leeuwenhoekiella aestuarii]|uniref:UDP-N-acetylmuramoyl-tripeptide--D-alanyl-D-alanine ligase n=1 Tax=Leeuwenhoekiella aestuarii TaxID=2249426 RepID=A0A4V1KNY4_9FLAO|nr:UDP-N-acetylmuramoyl-tripeptide--D-alanyl-D-alanine ligase [Leeuwenhoekiella aestuarii]RXG12667.1 UDP-N-acetylmuramoyl-tripeptide--D-alanyl-D-alanine ligase [Leeuwenhoekiella aestuarii]